MAGATLKISANATEFNRQMKEATNHLKLVNSECGLASQKAKLFGSAQDQLGAKQKELTSKIQAQTQIMKLHQDRVTSISKDIDKHKITQSQLKDEINKTSKSYEESVKATGKNSEESKKLKKELDDLEKEYQANEKALESSNKKLVDATVKMNNTEKALLENQKALQDLNKEMEVNKIDKLAEGFDKVGDKITNAGKKMTVVTGIITGIGAASVAAFNEVDKGADIVTTATGATGEALEGLHKSFKNVAGNVKDGFETVGGALGEVNTRFGFTGKELEDCTEKFLRFAEINGTDATKAVQLVSRAMGDAGIESKEYGKLLDQLSSAAQASGINIDTLTELCTKYGAPMRALGLTTQESIAIFAGWEKAGVNTDIAFSGMKAAIGKWGKEGKDAGKEFKKTLSLIEKTPNIAKATEKAIEVFGIKAGSN